MTHRHKLKRVELTNFIIPTNMNAEYRDIIICDLDNERCGHPRQAVTPTFFRLGCDVVPGATGWDAQRLDPVLKSRCCRLSGCRPARVSGRWLHLSTEKTAQRSVLGEEKVLFV
jgi:hypothetical protein